MSNEPPPPAPFELSDTVNNRVLRFTFDVDGGAMVYLMSGTNGELHQVSIELDAEDFHNLIEHTREWVGFYTAQRDQELAEFRARQTEEEKADADRLFLCTMVKGAQNFTIYTIHFRSCPVLVQRYPTLWKARLSAHDAMDRLRTAKHVRMCERCHPASTKTRYFNSELTERYHTRTELTDLFWENLELALSDALEEEKKK